MDLPRGGQRHEAGHRDHTPDRGDETGKTGKTEMTEMEEMAALPPPVATFHDTLAPRWHAEHGPQRMTATCAAVAQLHADAEAIVAAPPPSGADAAAWSAGGRGLADAVAGLDATCKANDAAGFEPAFARVHERFHGLVAAGAGPHDEHGEHPHGK